MNTPFNSVTSSPLVKIFLTFSIFVLILAILPSTPFMPYLQQINDIPFKGYINWVVPVGRCAAVMAVWWTCVVIYYAISWILRQIGIVGS